MNQAPSDAGLTAAPANRPKPRTIREEARDAILREQLVYLLDHAGACPENCPACGRLRRVEQILLEPFQVEFYLPAPPAV